MQGPYSILTCVLRHILGYNFIIIHATQEYYELYHKFLPVIHDINRVKKLHAQSNFAGELHSLPCICEIS